MRKLLNAIFDLHDFKRQLLLIILFCFLGSYLVVRFYSLLVGGSIFIEGYQIHHFYFGTLFITIGGVVSLLTEAKNYHRFAALLIGIGMGLFADELGLLLNCTTENHSCSYVFPDQYDFVGYIATILIILIALVRIYDWRKNKL